MTWRDRARAIIVEVLFDESIAVADKMAEIDRRCPFRSTAYAHRIWLAERAKAAKLLGIQEERK